MSELERMERYAAKLRKPRRELDPRHLSTREPVLDYHVELMIAGINAGDSWWAYWQACHAARAAVLYEDALGRTR